MKKISLLIVIIITVITGYSLYSNSCSATCEAEKNKHTVPMTQNKTMNTQSQTISWQEFKKRAEQDNTLVIDIRTQSEIIEGKLFDDALEIDYYADNFEDRISKLDPNINYLIYCRSGGRSGSALKIFEKYDLQAQDLARGYNSAM